MSNVLQIKQEVAEYLQIPVEDLVRNGVDLGLSAMNKARKKAEKLHEWNVTKTSLHLPLTGLKGSWVEGYETIGGSSVLIKQPETFYLLNSDGVTTPLRHLTKKDVAFKSIRSSRFNLSKFRPNTSPSFSSCQNVVILNGFNFELAVEPPSSQTLWCDCWKWVSDYEDDTDTDFFTEHGSEYLMWRIVVDTNHIFKTFTPQQEGNLSPPEKRVQEALGDLIEMDAYAEQGTAFL